MNLTVRSIILLLCVTFFCPSQADSKSSSAERAKSLIDEMEALYRGDVSKAAITMQILTPQYERTLELESLSQGRQNAFIRILSPKKDRGITTLKIGEEMWNYFPKINKVIKVPPSMMMGSWMGSDFTNDDLVKQTSLIDEYALALAETEDTYLVTLTPKTRTVTVWGKIEYSIDKANLVPIYQKFYDDKNVMVRLLEFTDLRNFSGRLLPSSLAMTPMNKPGHKTLVIYEVLEFDPEDVSDATFTLRNLQSRF
jgi:outer membrane lipoprotein-sorting protein